MKADYELQIQRDAKKRLRVSFGTWGSRQGSHVIYPTEAQLVEMATKLLNAAQEMKQDRLGRARFKRGK